MSRSHPVTSSLLYLLLAASTQISAQTLSNNRQADVGFAELPTIDIAELDTMRGGLRVGGLDIDVGAAIRTIIDGTQTLESTVYLTAGGSTSPQMLKISDDKGFTQVLHDISQQRIVSTLLNEANQRKIETRINIDVTVKNFTEIQAAAARGRILRNLSNR